MELTNGLRRGGAEGHPLRRGAVQRCCGIGVSLALLVTAACQSYREAPLDEGLHRARWHGEGVVPADTSLGAAASGGETAALPRGLDRARATALAQANHGALRLLRLEWDTAKAQAQIAGGLADPTLEAEVRRAESGSDPWIVAAGVGFAIPLSGRRAALRASGEAHAQSIGFAVLELEADVALELNRRWWAHGAARLRAQFWERQFEAWSDWAAKVDVLAELGELAPADGMWLEVAQQEQRLALERARGDTATTGAHLWTYLGLAPEHREELHAELDLANAANARGLSSPTDTLETAWVDRHPRLLRLRAEYEMAEAELRLQIALQMPDLVLGPSVESDEGRLSLGVFGALGLPVFQSNRVAIEEARRAREHKRLEVELAYESLVAQRAELGTQEQSLRELHGLVLSELEPRARVRAERSWDLVRAGEAPVLLALEAERALHDIEMEQMELLHARAALDSAIQHLLLETPATGASSPKIISESNP